MTLTLAFDDGQQAIHDALAGFCTEKADDAVGRITWSRGLWAELGELGIFAPCTSGGEGGALEIVAAMEALGGAGCPGPFGATYFATQCLPEDTADAVADGRSLVALGANALFPFGPDADLFIEIDQHQARLGMPSGAIEHVQCLGGEPAARAVLTGTEPLAELDRAHALCDIARAAQIAGCGRQLVALASEHARDRKQFRKPIGDFQGVAHPLADAHMAFAAATGLARVAAFDFDLAASSDDPPPMLAAAKSRLSASHAALETIHVVHQVFGAVGITLEGPIYHLTRRLRQWVGDAPSMDLARDVVVRGLGWPPVANS